MTPFHNFCATFPKDTSWIPSKTDSSCQSIMWRIFCRLKEAPMEERELEIVDLGGKETSEERVKRIKETRVTFQQFLQCIDFQMLRFFAGMLLFIIAGVIVVTFFYLIIIYTFKFAMWDFYFPKQPFDQMKTELWNGLKRNCDFRNLLLHMIYIGFSPLLQLRSIIFNQHSCFVSLSLLILHGRHTLSPNLFRCDSNFSFSLKLNWFYAENLFKSFISENTSECGALTFLQISSWLLFYLVPQTIVTILEVKQVAFNICNSVITKFATFAETFCVYIGCAE